MLLMCSGNNDAAYMNRHVCRTPERETETASLCDYNKRQQMYVLGV